MNNRVLGNNNGDLGAVAGSIDGDETSGIQGDNNSVIGSSNNVAGNSNQVTGNTNNLGPGSDNNFVGGSHNATTGASNILVGNGNSIGATSNNLVVGDTGATAADAGSVATGSSAVAANGGAAYGNGSTATGLNSTAIGPNASATPNGSAAFGNNAVATLENQQSFGTKDNTYTMGGITSNQSQARQSGPLELVTTDANGNLASDNGSTFKTIAELQAGVSIALAAEAPSLTSSEQFGFRIGWGNFNGDGNAVAASAIGVLCRGCFTFGDRVAIDGSVGAGWAEYKAYSAGNVIGGRAGIQWTW